MARYTSLTHGTCRWLDNASNGNLRLEMTVNGRKTVYEIEEASKGFELYYRTDKPFRFYHYSIRTHPRNVWTCNCPSSKEVGSTNCKHVRALRNAWAKLPF